MLKVYYHTAFSGPYAGPTTITTPTSGGSSSTTLFDASSLRSIIIAVIVAIIVFIVSLCVYWHYRRRYNKRDFIVESKPSSSSPLAFDGSLLFPTDDYRDSFVGTPFGGNTHSRNTSTRNLNETPRDSFAASLTRYPSDHIRDSFVGSPFEMSSVSPGMSPRNSSFSLSNRDSFVGKQVNLYVF